MNINFCKIPYLNNNYDNVIDFSSKLSRLNFFNSKKLLTLDINTRIGSYLTSLSVNRKLSDLKEYDYLFFTYNDKDYFYFINDKEMINDNNTMLYVSKDVFTTHQFDVEYMDSFVDRCHVPRWDGDIPTRNTVEEGLDFGELIQIGEPTIVKEFSDTVIIASSVPIGQLPSGGSGGGNGSIGEIGEPPYNAVVDNNDKKRKFVHSIFKGAVSGYNSDNLFASVCIGMAIEESGWGTSELSIKANNFFGQKWVEGAGDYYVNPLDGIKYRKYSTPDEGALGLLKFLKDYERYKDVFNAKSPLEQLRKIQQAGYNPDSSYPDRIMNLINQNNLTVYDIKVTSGNGDYDGYKSFDNAFGSGWLCPVKNAKVTSKYGWRNHPITGDRKFHKGTDIGKAEGSPTVASKDGTVMFAGFNNQGFGNLVILNHNNKYKSYYPHLSKISVKEGDNVKRGQVVGLIGSTGDSTGPHCHWEIRDYNTNESTDPAPILKVGSEV